MSRAMEIGGLPSTDTWRPHGTPSQLASSSCRRRQRGRSVTIRRRNLGYFMLLAGTLNGAIFSGTQNQLQLRLCQNQLPLPFPHKSTPLGPLSPNLCMNPFSKRWSPCASDCLGVWVTEERVAPVKKKQSWQNTNDQDPPLILHIIEKIEWYVDTCPRAHAGIYR